MTNFNKTYKVRKMSQRCVQGERRYSYGQTHRQTET